MNEIKKRIMAAQGSLKINEIEDAQRHLSLASDLADKLPHDGAKSLYTVSSYEEESGKFRGIVSNIGDRGILWTTSTYSNAERAERNAAQQFQKALFQCNHKWGKWSDEHSEDTSWGGIEYVSQCECENCGLVQYSFDDRSRYDQDRDY
jgi:hypothetical protein